MFVTEYVSGDDQSFLMIDDGLTSVVPGVGTQLDFLGGTLVVRSTIVPDGGGNYPNQLVRMSSAANGANSGIGFLVPLGAGNYTINFQNFTGETMDYTMQLTVVPEPGHLASLAAAASLAMMDGRRRRS